MAATPKSETAVPESFRALEWVRAVRDKFYETTRGMTPDEVRAYIAHEAASGAPTDRPASTRSDAA